MMIGKMDQRITLQRVTQTADGMGGSTEAWADLATVWAWVRPLSGREMIDAQRQAAQTRYRATIRFRGDANGAPYYLTSDRVIWKGREYGIEGVVEVGRRDKIEIRMIEGALS